MANALQLHRHIKQDECRWVNDKGHVCVDLYAKALYVDDLWKARWIYYWAQECGGDYVHHARLVGGRWILVKAQKSSFYSLTPRIAYNVYFDIKVVHNVTGFCNPLVFDFYDNAWGKHRHLSSEVQLSPGDKQVLVGSFVSSSHNDIEVSVFTYGNITKIGLVVCRVRILPAGTTSSPQGCLQKPEDMSQLVRTGEHGHGCICEQSSEDVHYYFDDKGRACVDLYAKALNILNGNNPDCWRYDILALGDGDYVHQAELVADRNLEVKAQHSTVCNLAPKTPYNVFFDIKLLHVARGFGCTKVIFELTDIKGDIRRSTPLQLYPGETRVFVGQFIVNPKLQNVINVKMYNFNGQEKSGLIVRRVMIKPLDT